MIDLQQPSARFDGAQKLCCLLRSLCRSKANLHAGSSGSGKRAVPKPAAHRMLTLVMCLSDLMSREKSLCIATSH